MRSRLARVVMIALVVSFSVCLCFDEASAQRRRTKRSRRVTNPITRPAKSSTVPSTQSTDAQIISTADQQTTDANDSTDLNAQVSPTPRRTTRRRAAEPEDEESVRRTVNDLTNQVTKLTEKLTQMEQSQRTLVDLERLSRAEQRAELLRTQMRDVQDKEGNLLARMEQIEFDSKPENIERTVATFGSTRPEDARDARRRALESEKLRVRAQLDLFTTSKQRLETAIINADLEVDKLRKRLEDSAEPPAKTETTENTTDTDANDEIDATPPTTRPRSNSPATSPANPPR